MEPKPLGQGLVPDKDQSSTFETSANNTAQRLPHQQHCQHHILIGFWNKQYHFPEVGKGWEKVGKLNGKKKEKKNFRTPKNDR